jgi:RNA polymerase sigma-70 factor (ECF subfamily)
MRNSFCTKFGLSKREHVGFEDDVAGERWIVPTQDWSLRGRELEEAMSELPDHYRVPLILVLIDGVSYEDAAERCQCPIGTIKSRVNRARQVLARQLNSEG